MLDVFPWNMPYAGAAHYAETIKSRRNVLICVKSGRE